MSKITLDAAVASQLHGLTQDVEVCDTSSAFVITQVRPVPCLSCLY
jgi:hypothetical protein